MSFFANAQDTIRVNNLGIEPNSRINTIPFINKVMESCKDKKNVVVLFKKGRYDFWPDQCTEKIYYELNTTISNPRRCAFVVEKSQNITIDCGGSEFIFHDKMQPFTIDNSNNICVKNVSIDWDIPFNAEVELLEVSPEYFDLKIDTKQFPYTIENNKLYFVGEGWKNMWGEVKWNDPMEFDKETLEVTQGTDDDLLGENWEKKYTAKEIGEGIVRITYSNTKLLKKGNYLVLRHGIRDHAGVFMTNSKNILLENINMYSNKGMSFLAQFTENITYKNVNCIPNPTKRKIISGHDDGLHHTNCKGQITVENCNFRGLMDDGFNAHGTCVKIVEKVNDKKLICKFMHPQSLGVIWAREGENIGFIKRENMQTVSNGTVESFKAIDTVFFEITFKKSLPEKILKNDVLENLTWTPNVTITKSHFYSQRARSILVSTPGKVIIDNNVFESSGSAIVIPGDANNWYETGAVKDVTISNNLFKGNCLTSMYQFTEGIISIYPEIPNLDLLINPYHRNIRILNNTFEMFDYPVLFVLNTNGISFKNNIIKKVNTHTPFHTRKFTLTFDACRNIEVKGNVLDKEVLGKNIQLIRTKPSELKLDKNQGFIIEKGDVVPLQNNPLNPH